VVHFIVMFIDNEHCKMMNINKKDGCIPQ